MFNFKTLLLIALGGAFGALLRYLVNTMAQISINKYFPFGILIVNIAGCMLIGYCYAYFQSEQVTLSPSIRLGITVGLLGGLTTFSTFSLDTLVLMQEAQYLKAGANVVANVVLCLIAVSLGAALGHKLLT